LQKSVEVATRSARDPGFLKKLGKSKETGKALRQFLVPSGKLQVTDL
jgi:hypothetical protein